jgi:hypothetical protein
MQICGEDVKDAVRTTYSEWTKLLPEARENFILEKLREKFSTKHIPKVGPLHHKCHVCNVNSLLVFVAYV